MMKKALSLVDESYENRGFPPRLDFVFAKTPNNMSYSQIQKIRSCHIPSRVLLSTGHTGDASVIASIAVR